MIKNLGLAYRAKKITLGADETIKAISKNKIVLVLLASDASENTIKKITDKCYFYKVELSQSFNSIELSSALGKNNIKVIGIKDEGFKNIILT
jgi:ribosomal protein L7Ae-like RNA K-turn-binding protein